MDRITVHTFIKQSCFFSINRDLVSFKIGQYFGQDCGSISMLYLLTYCQSIGGFQVLFDEANEYFIVEGTDAICKKLAQKVGDIYYNQPVKEITDLQNGKVSKNTYLKGINIKILFYR